jgi:hypothetical protein
MEKRRMGQKVDWKLLNAKKRQNDKTLNGK